MNPNEKRMPVKYRGVKITSGFVITAVAVLICCLFLLFLMKIGVIASPVFLQPLFGSASAEVQSGEVRKSAIPDFSADAVSEEEFYHTFPPDARKTLEALTEPESYVREFRVINSYGGETDLQKYTLTVRGDCRRLESDFKTVICDGTNICTITETYRTLLNNTVFTPENEIGITTLADIKAAAEKGSVAYPDRTRAEKTLLVTAEDAESGILSEYVISLETGVVMAERSYLRGEMYRAVVTDAVDIFAAEDLPDDFFRIPAAP